MKYFSVVGGQVAVDENNIAWWYHAGQLVVITYVNGSSIGLTFATIPEAIAAKTILAETLYRDMASVPATSGIVYNLQCKYLRTYSLSTATFTFNFPVTSLTVICDSAASALMHQSYIDNVIYSARLSRNAIGKTLVHVTTTIQSTIDSASSGNMVIVPKGYYYEKLTLKNGVDIYFEHGATLVYGFNTGETQVMVADNVTCKILGHGVFIYGSSALGTPNSLFNCTNASTVFWEFETVYTKREVMYVNTLAATKVTVKGRGFDSDSFELLDIDVVRMKVGREFWFGYSLAGANLITRNTLFELTNTDSAFNMAGTFDPMNIQLVNIAGKLFTQGSILVVGGDYNTNSKVFNTYFEGGSGSNSFKPAVGSSVGIMTVVLYGNNYFNVNYDTGSGRVSLSGGSYVLNTSLTIYAS